MREQSEAVGPTRALWVPFPLGRPLGSASDAEFQRSVVRAALDLLSTQTEPGIVDFPTDAPDVGEQEPWACPLNLAPATGDSFADRLSAEASRFLPWAAETRRRRGRSLFGASGAAPDQQREVVQALGSIADSGDLTDVPDVGIEWAFEMPLLIRHLVDDVRTIYHEALAAQPGSRAPTHDDLNDWIFESTVLGEVIIAIADHLTAAADEQPMLAFIRGFVVPEGRYRDQSSF
ncbi:MAG: hypothetical protein AAGF73_03960 [Actinomycetota bacterium]